MVKVNLNYKKQTKLGVVPAKRVMLWKPLRTVIEDDTIILPKGFIIDVKTGKEQINISPNTEYWCWMVYEDIYDPYPKYLNVPNIESINYTELVNVDPVTLKPTGPKGPKGDPGNTPVFSIGKVETI